MQEILNRMGAQNRKSSKEQRRMQEFFDKIKHYPVIQLHSAVGYSLVQYSLRGDALNLKFAKCKRNLSYFIKWRKFLNL